MSPLPQSLDSPTSRGAARPRARNFRSRAGLSQRSASCPNSSAALDEVLPTLAENYELVLVNDNSPDNSWDVISPSRRAAPVDSCHQPDAQLRPAQRAAVRNPRHPVRHHRHHGRRPPASARGNPRTARRPRPGIRRGLRHAVARTARLPARPRFTHHQACATKRHGRRRLPAR